MPETEGATGLELQVEGLELCAPGGRRLLQVVRLDAAPGRSIAVCGPSGAGKSSLLHALAGLVRPRAGRIAWGGRDIASLSEASRTRFRRESLGLVFQDFLLFEEMGALDNAALAASFSPRSERARLRDDARRWLDRLGLPGAEARRVDGFSGGERQRVAVARALVRDAPVILADEPTASLDRANADRLIEDLVAVAQAPGRTLVVVTHDHALIRRMDRVLTLEDGRIVEDTDE